MAFKTGPTASSTTRIDNDRKATLTNVAMPTTGVLEVNSIAGGATPITSPMRGTVKGLIAGGESSSNPVTPNFIGIVESFPFANESNVLAGYSTLKMQTASSTGHSSTIDGYTVAGQTKIVPSTGSSTPGIPIYTDQHFLKSIDKIPFSTQFTTTFVGNLSGARFYAGGHSSPTGGYVSGGRHLLSGIQINSIPSPINPGSQYSIALTSIETFPFTTGGIISSYVGDLAVESSQTATQSDETHGYSCQNSTGLYARTVPGAARTGQVRIDKFPFSTSVTSTDIGDAIGNLYQAGISAPAPGFGYIAGYFEHGTGFLTGIQKFPFASGGFSAIIGGLSQGTSTNAGLSSTTNGYSIAGAINTPGGSTRIERFPFAADTSATYVSNISEARVDLSCSFQD